MSERKTLYYIFIVTLIAASLIAYFLSIPLVNRINDYKNNLQEKQAELSNLNKKEEALKKISTSYNKYKQQFDLVTESLPKTKEISDYITQLEGAASQSGLSIQSIKVGGQAQTGGQKEQSNSQYSQLAKVGDIYTLPIDISMSSNNFGNFQTFIETLEKLSRFTTVQKISLKNSTSNKSLDTSISLTIYVLP